MSLSVILIGVYAVLLFGGGLMGFLKAGSKPSLIAGTLSAILLGVAFWMAQSKENGAKGLWMASAVAALLTVVFLMRFLKTHAFMPSGMMLVMSAVAAGYFAYAAR